MNKWLSIIGIGEDGLGGVNPVGRSLIDQAEVLFGGERHLDMLPKSDHRKKIPWTFPIDKSIKTIINYRHQPVCVLASGDPMCYGIGTTILKHIPINEIIIIPSPSTFSLACARLGWSLTDTETLSLCGRDPALLNSIIYPNAQLLILSADHKTPLEVAKILTKQGFGKSKIIVLEHLGGPKEQIITGIAATWTNTDLADLNAIAITCIGESSQCPSRIGLPDNAYHHDGQLTKREIRSITLSSLSPLPGQLLWDIGSGCGSIAIEWMRYDHRCKAIAIEKNQTRLKYIADNAIALGTPHLKTIPRPAPEALTDLAQPDAIFIGGGLTTPRLLDTCWDALITGGKLVANAVTIESEQILFEWQNKMGGDLTRIAICRSQPLGQFLTWKAMSPVTQWVVQKG